MADCGLDNDRLRRKLHENGILAVIDTRHLWQADNLDPDAAQEECYRLGQVRAGARSRVVRTQVNAGHLRQRPALLQPSTVKWNRLYRQRSAMERINSRVADGFMLHSYYLRDRQSMGLKVTISMTVMMAAANFAM